MAYRNGNYTAFYVAEPFSESNLGAHSTPDFVYYNLLRAWKGQDAAFPFNDSHAKNYNVRDGSDWEKTLKPRIRERLNNSKNLVLFLSSSTKNSRALREEITFGVGTNLLPVIVIYPEYSAKSDIINCQAGTIQEQVAGLWESLPAFRDSMATVPTLHIPNVKALVTAALNDPKFVVDGKAKPGIYFYPC